MNRKQELLNCFKNVNDDRKIIIVNLIDEMIFLENQLLQLKKLPMIKVHPKNNTLIRPTPVSKLYKEFFQQYTNSIKVLQSFTRGTEEKEESPLEKYLKGLQAREVV